MNNELMFSSKTDDWATPKYFYDALDREFGFHLDPCSSVENHKAPFYYTRDDDGLALPWFCNVFMNPPYGREIGKWMQKAHDETFCGNANIVFCLVPARTDVRWFQNFAMRAAEIRLVSGRIAFGDGKMPAPFPCVVVVFRHGFIGKCKLSTMRVDKS